VSSLCAVIIIIIIIIVHPFLYHHKVETSEVVADRLTNYCQLL